MSFCSNNLKQLTQLCIEYADTSNDYIPTAWTGSSGYFWFYFLSLAGLCDLPEQYTSTTTQYPSKMWACPNANKYERVIGIRTHYGMNRFGNSWGIYITTSKVKEPTKTVLLFDTGIYPSYTSYSYHTSLTDNANISANRHNSDKGRHYSFVDGHIEYLDKYDVASSNIDIIWTL